MSEFSWSSGGLYGKQWGEHLPTDAGVGFVWDPEVTYMSPVMTKGVYGGFRQTGLYSNRRWLEAWNFGLRKKRDCTI